MEKLDEKQIMKDYFDMLNKEEEEKHKQDNKTLDEVKSMVYDKYFKAIKDWLEDEENGIYGNLEIVDDPRGDWQDEELDYWSELKGMYIDQRVGYSGDDYSGYLAINLTDKKYLQAYFSL